MPYRLVVGSVVVCLLTGCASQQRQIAETAAVPVCDYVVASEVDGVTVATATGQRQVSAAGEKLEFELPCGKQSFSLAKPCYESRQVTLAPAPEGEYVLTQEAWQHYGYLRVENGSASEPLAITRLSGASLEIPAFSHASRKVPLGDYRVEVSAPFKVPVDHDFRLCSKDDIYSLRVGTEGPAGELQAQGSQEITLEHGMGTLRVVTETPNVTFRIEPDRSEDLRRYLEKVGVEVSDVDLEQAPEALRKALELLQRFGGKRLRAPTVLKLPAGKYTVDHSSQEKSEGAIVVEIPAAGHYTLQM